MNKMEYISIFGLVSVLFLIIRVDARVKGIVKTQDSSFDENYVVTWGQNNVLKLNQGKEVQLSMDKSSGSGFESKNHYGSGFFQIRMNMPPKDIDTSGVVIAFYLTSKGNTQDEVDFEFLGNEQGKPISLQTNLFTNGQGNREQRIVTWFDPTQDFHTYEILWNPYHIVFYVDKIPIREEFKNLSSKGINYPSKPMQLVVSLWNGEAWATEGGKRKINWSYAPFKANFQGFNNSGCFVNNGESKSCDSSANWWNTGSYSKLSDSDQKALRNVKEKNMNYDYCSDRRLSKVVPSECKWNK